MSSLTRADKLQDYACQCSPYWQADNGNTSLTLYHDDAINALRCLPDESVQTCITSPPYWGLRDYGVDGQIGLEPTLDEYVERLVSVFREVRRVLRDDGTLWLNLGTTYVANVGSGFKPSGGRQRGTLGSRNPFKHPTKPKDLVGIPWRVAFALQADGWYLRSDIIWAKPNPMPESVKDRPTKAHEYLFLLAKNRRYYYDADAIREPYTSRMRPLKEQSFHANGRNKRTVWTVATQPYKSAHFATFPPKLIEPCILAGCPVGGTVLDPFNGAGTTMLVAQRLGRSAIGIDLSSDYCDMAIRRVEQEQRRR